MSKILVVDDEELVTEALQRLFLGEGFEAFVAASAEAAFSILEEHEVDVIISDERMPGLSGVDFLTVARRRYPEAVRILVTGYATVESALKAINEGEIHRLFVKPCDFRVLKQVVSEVLEAKKASERVEELEATIARQESLIQMLQARCIELEGEVPDLPAVAPSAL